MKGLIYISRAMVPLDQAQIQELVEHASKNNRDLGITGYLSYDGQENFIQYIEGPADNLTQLFDKIYKDKRHRITHFINRNISKKVFPDWSMRLIEEVEFKEIHDLMICHLFHSNSAPSVIEYKNKLIWTTVDAMSENFKQTA